MSGKDVKARRRREAEAARPSIAQDLKFHRITLRKISDSHWCFDFRGRTLMNYWPGTQKMGRPGNAAEPNKTPDAAAKRVIQYLKNMKSWEVPWVM